MNALLQELQRLYLERHPECKGTVDEFVKLGLADHPDFVRLIETGIVEPIDLVANDRAKVFADRLLDSARLLSVRPNCGVIDGHRCGVQSCDSREANVYVEIRGEISYVRIDRENLAAIKQTYPNPAYDFVRSHFDAFEQLCANLDQAKVSSIEAKKGRKGASPGM